MLPEIAATIATEHPVLTSLLTLWIAWSLSSYIRKRSGGLLVSSASKELISHDEGVRAARERQQKRLEEAASSRGATASLSSSTDCQVKTFLPGSQSKQVKAVLPGSTSSHIDSKLPSKCNLTTSERLAKIEKGKGPSNTNPLAPQSKASTAGSSFCTKKGG